MASAAHEEIVARLPESFDRARASGELFFFPSTVHKHTEHGVDVLDVSSAGSHPKQALPPLDGEAVQADLSEAIKASVGDKLVVTTVGHINTGKTAQAVLDKGQADAVFVGRQFQKEPGTVWKFADDLGITISAANQISWGFVGRGTVKTRQ